MCINPPPPPSLSLPQVDKAEAALLSIRRLLDDGQEDSPGSETLANLSKEFYEALPHKAAAKKTIDNKRLIAQKQDLCQVRQLVVENSSWLYQAVLSFDVIFHYLCHELVSVRYVTQKTYIFPPSSVVHCRR